jgi:hypothetical protein
VLGSYAEALITMLPPPGTSKFFFDAGTIRLVRSDSQPCFPLREKLCVREKLDPGADGIPASEWTDPNQF